MRHYEALCLAALVVCASASADTSTGNSPLQVGSVNACPRTDWECGQRLTQCGEPGESCYCDLSVEDEEVCFPTMSCSGLPLCDFTSDCPLGYACVTTCCFGGAPACLPRCDDFSGENNLTTTSSEPPECVECNLTITAACPPDTCGDFAQFNGDLGVGDDIRGSTRVARQFWRVDRNGGSMRFSLCGDTFYDSAVAIWIQLGDGSFRLVAFNDDSCGLKSELKADTRFWFRGFEYFFLIGGYGRDRGLFHLEVFDSFNDSFTTEFSTTDMVSSSEAPCVRCNHVLSSNCPPNTCGDEAEFKGTVESGDIVRGSTRLARQYWLIQRTGGPMEFSLCENTFYDSAIAIWRRLFDGTWELVASNDDSCGLRSRLRVDSGTWSRSPHFVLVGGYDVDVGLFQLAVYDFFNFESSSSAFSTTLFSSTERSCGCRYAQDVRCPPDSCAHFQGTIRVGDVYFADTFSERQMWFVHPTGLPMKFSLCGNETDYDSTIAIWEWVRNDSSWALVDWNDDECGLKSELVVDTRFWLRNYFFVLVGGYGGDTGRFRIEVSGDPTMTTSEPGVCEGRDWQCGDPQDQCGPESNCYCDLDIEGSQTCWRGDVSCNSLTRCLRSSDCGPGLTCARHCCGGGADFWCTPTCGEDPITTSTDISTTSEPGVCEGQDWRCGDPQDQCGPESNCYCDLDIDGSDTCWRGDVSCTSLTRCVRSADCGPGLTCARHCCGGGADFWCTPTCGEDPITTTTSSEPPLGECEGRDWMCGDAQTQCGEDENCYCDLSVERDEICWPGTFSCEDTRGCRSSDDCRGDWSCATTCCRREQPVCVPPCYPKSKSPTSSPVPAPTTCSRPRQGTIEVDCAHLSNLCGEFEWGRDRRQRFPMHRECCDGRTIGQVVFAKTRRGIQMTMNIRNNRRLDRVVVTHDGKEYRLDPEGHFTFQYLFPLAEVGNVRVTKVSYEFCDSGSLS